MLRINIILASALFVFKYTTIVSAALNANLDNSTTSVARCFSFTWLGPQFNNESIFLNATCQDATKLAAGVPCFEPLVASYDGTWPDVEYIWRNHRLQATCVLSNNDVCAQYTYYFNGHAENSTYMCTRAVDNEGVAITSGCFQRVNGSSTTRVCFCQSVPGGVPCNDAVVSTSPFVFLFITLIVMNFNNIIISNTT